MQPAQPQGPSAPRESETPHEPVAPRAAHDAPPPTSPSEPRGLGERALRWVVPEQNPAAAVYGLVTIGALLAAESGLRDTYPETIGSVAIAALLYWFAHSYANVLGVRLSEQRSLSGKELWQAFIQDWAIVRGAGIPVLALLVAWAVGASQQAAVTAGVWTAVASLIGFESIASIRSRAKPIQMALEVSVGASMGLAILVLRALLH
ncbi:MAG: hypothetical protein WBQ21_12680 [Solirubrobacteraceae bacterium]